MTWLLDHWWLVLAVWVVLSFIVGPLVLPNADLDFPEWVNDPPPPPDPSEAVARALTAASEAVAEHLAVVGIAKGLTTASEAVAEHSQFPGRGGERTGPRHHGFATPRVLPGNRSTTAVAEGDNT